MTQAETYQKAIVERDHEERVRLHRLAKKSLCLTFPDGSSYCTARYGRTLQAERREA